MPRGRPHNMIVTSGSKVLSLTPKELKRALGCVSRGETYTVEGKDLGTSVADLSTLTAITAKAMLETLYPAEPAAPHRVNPPPQMEDLASAEEVTFGRITG